MRKGLGEEAGGDRSIDPRSSRLGSFCTGANAIRTIAGMLASAGRSGR
jgi:hypothetical protein